MPDKPFEWVPKENLLSLEELFGFVKIAMDAGVKKVRITGGEPLLRQDLHKFVRMVASHDPDVDLSMTTNAYLLASHAKELRDAGLRRVNVSLDTLKRDVAQKIAQKDVLDDVIKGIEAAHACGLGVKINMVPMQGVNDTEILDVMEYCKDLGVQLRYIEYMENSYAGDDLKGLGSEEILARIQKRYGIEDMGSKKGSPAHEYATGEGYGFGIIEPHKDDFCTTCNRLRLTAEGYLIPCLYFDEARSIKDHIQHGNLEAAKSVLEQVVRDKPEKNRWSEEEAVSSRAFYQTGG
jgi:cyclic pyranopterin phosphate synthase